MEASFRQARKAILAKYGEEITGIAAEPSHKRKAINDGKSVRKKAKAKASGSGKKVCWIHLALLTVPLIIRYPSFLLSISREIFPSKRHILRKNGPTTPLAVSSSRSLLPAVPANIFGAASTLVSSQAPSAAARLPRPLVRRLLSSGGVMSRARVRWNMAQTTRERSPSVLMARYAAL
jgi:hypothetical protein